MELTTSVGITCSDFSMKHTISIKDITEEAKIPKDCRAKLMYYLHCFAGISKFLQLHREWAKYIEVNNYEKLTIKEEEELYHICNDVITEDVAHKTGFIEVEDKVLTKSTNEFYEVTDTNEAVLNQFHVRVSVDSIYAMKIEVGEKKERKLRVMLYGKHWIAENYYMPIQHLSNMIEKHKIEFQRKIHNEEVLEDNKRNIIFTGKRKNIKYPNCVRLLLILYSILTIGALIYFMIFKKTDDKSWFKWFKLVGFITLLINSIFGVICFILVCASCCFEKWIVYLNYLLNLMVCISILSITGTIVADHYIPLAIEGGVTVIIFFILFALKKNTNVNPYCICLCCGLRHVSPTKFNYEL